MRLRFAPQARTDLIDIRDWIAVDRPRAAREVIARSRQTATLLGQLPGVGRSGRVAGTYEFPVTGLPYTIVYSAGQNAVTILAVVHQSRRYP